jgi:hypothetical protein
MKLNYYGNEYGYHSPQTTKRVAVTLQRAGIRFTDGSYHNDEYDCFELDHDYMLWVVLMGSDGNVMEVEYTLQYRKTGEDVYRTPILACMVEFVKNTFGFMDGNV